MAEKGAALQTYNVELVKGIEGLKKKRFDLIQTIREDEQKKELLEQELVSVTERLSTVRSSLDDKLQKKKFYDDSIEKSELVYMKIVESSQALLDAVHRDTCFKP